MGPIYIKDLIAKGKLNTSLEGYNKYSLVKIEEAIQRGLDVRYLLIPKLIIDRLFNNKKQAEDCIFSRQINILRLLEDERQWGLAPGTLAGELNINVFSIFLPDQIEKLSEKYLPKKEEPKKQTEEQVKEERDQYKNNVLKRLNSYLGKYNK